MAEDGADKTEPATDKRREDSRRKGQVAQSRELQSVMLLVAALLLLGSGLAINLVHQSASIIETAWSAERPQTLDDFHVAILHSFMVVAGPLISMIVLFTLAGATGAFVQIGPLLSFEALKPRGDRMSPLQGAKRLVDLDRLFDLGKALFKVVIVGTITWNVVSDSLDQIIGLAGAPLEAALFVAGGLAQEVAIGTLVFLGIMAVIDVLYQRWRFEKRLRMSKKEIRDELKDREGNPQMRSRTRAMQRELSRSRMIAAVADASVVVTNPTHYAVALQYQQAEGAPKVLAKGRNHVAARIREIARENGVPIVENRPLARLLHRTSKVGSQIPESLFQAVAEILAYVYRLDPARGQAWRAAK